MSEQTEPATAPAPGPAEQPKKPASLRRAFFTGLAAVLPTALTLVILVWIIRFIHTYVARPINEFILWIMELAGVQNHRAVFLHQEVTIEGETVRLGIIDFTFAGYVIAFGAIFAIGFVAFTLFGRRLYRAVDRLLSRIPVLRMIYPHVKQLTEFIFSDDKVSTFRRVVMVEYPRRGLWSLGFVTGPGMVAARTATDKDLVTIFVPSSPTPFTGYVVAASAEDVIDVPISVDEALRFTVSGGVLVPPRQRVAPTEPAGGDPPPAGDAPGER
jgi:uncharacterized membrane protein